MARSILAIISAFVCCGQVCAPPPAGFPTPQQLGSVIPEGVYEGTSTTRARSHINTMLLEENTDTTTTTTSFGPDGLPLTKQNTSIFVGYTEAASVGGASFTQAVTAIRSVNNGVSIDYDVTMDFPIEGERFVLTGVATDVYSLLSDGRLNNIYNMYVAFITFDGAVLSLELDGSAMLHR